MRLQALHGCMATIETLTRDPMELAQSPEFAHLHVRDLAHAVGVSPATVRYYDRIGLLRGQRDPHNRYRRFTGRDVTRLHFIRRAQAFGLTIRDVREILEIADHNRLPCKRVVELLKNRRAGIAQRIDELHRTRARIDAAIDEWEMRAADGALTAGGRFCPIIEDA